MAKKPNKKAESDQKVEKIEIKEEESGDEINYIEDLRKRNAENR